MFWNKARHPASLASAPPLSARDFLARNRWQVYPRTYRRVRRPWPSYTAPDPEFHDIVRAKWDHYAWDRYP